MYNYGSYHMFLIIDLIMVKIMYIVIYYLFLLVKGILNILFDRSLWKKKNLMAYFIRDVQTFSYFATRISIWQNFTIYILKLSTFYHLVQVWSNV